MHHFPEGKHILCDDYDVYALTCKRETLTCKTGTSQLKQRIVLVSCLDHFLFWKHAHLLLRIILLYLLLSLLLFDALTDQESQEGELPVGWVSLFQVSHQIGGFGAEAP